MTRCPQCRTGEITAEDREMNRKIDGVQVCGDCYFGALGEVVEKSPIVNPTRK